jgi:hypothetical protein
MSAEFDILKSENKFDFQGVIIHARKRLSLKGEVASRLVEHFAIVAAQDDGEDSAGRRAFKLQTPEQVVTRACDIANNLVDEFEKRGWVIEIPAYEDIPVARKAG